MKKYLQIVIATLLASFCLFPIALQAFKGANFKMVMAAVGVVLLIINWIRNRSSSISHPLLWLTIISIGLSLCAYTSVTINNTNDFTLVSFVVSMLVWFFAAYVVCLYIKHVHSRIDLILISKYLVAVCVFQCASALLIDYVPAVGQIYNGLFFNELVNPENAKTHHRIYGFGAALDVAGIRFSCVLVLLVNILLSDSEHNTKGSTIVLWISYFFIVAIGNMISRTTTIGAIISFTYFLLASIQNSRGKIDFGSYNRATMVLSLFIAIILVVYFYRHNDAFQTHLRFGFEAFFNYFDSGEWETNSTNILRSMMRWPKSLKTWMIGDGWFANPDGGGFYMYTDVGYIRFIYYFGMPGLLCYIALYICAAYYGIKLSPDHKMVFLLLFAINMIVWIKVSTDTFVVFALLLNACIISHDDEQQKLLEEHETDAGTQVILHT